MTFARWRARRYSQPSIRFLIFHKTSLKTMQKFFITGGAGFIGSAFVQLVLDEIPNCTIVNFDALTYAGNLDNLKGLDHERHHFVRGDIADPEAVLTALDPGT